MRHPSRLLAACLSLVAVSSLSGCGGDAGPTHKVIYTSSGDCANGGHLDFDKCDKAIEKAIVEHEKTAPKFLTLADCEKAEGNDRCEKAAERQYRPRLMGFFFTINSKKSSALPLYAGLKGTGVFRNAEGAVFDHERTADVKFSRDAAMKSAGFVPHKKGGRG